MIMAFIHSPNCLLNLLPLNTGALGIKFPTHEFRGTYLNHRPLLPSPFLLYLFSPPCLLASIFAASSCALPQSTLPLELESPTCTDRILEATMSLAQLAGSCLSLSPLSSCLSWCLLVLLSSPVNHSLLWPKKRPIVTCIALRDTKAELGWASLDLSVMGSHSSVWWF